MQSRKASNSKKTRKNTDEAVVTENSVAAAAAAAEVKAKPRASRSSRSKKETPPEVPSARGHRKSAVSAIHIPATESPLVAKALPEEKATPKVMAAAAGTGFEFATSEAAVIAPIEIVTAVESSVTPQYSCEDVAKLAYFYWIARGYSHGYADEDWLRAEAELSGKR